VSRWLTILFSAAESILVILIGVGIPLALGSIVWAVEMGFGPEWTVVWRAAADVWLLGHGVDVTFTLDPSTAAALGLPGAELPVTFSIALLGFALLTLLLAVRAGRRVAEVGHPIIGLITEIIVFGLASAGIVVAASHPAAEPNVTQGVVLPTLTFLIGILVGLATSQLRRDARAQGQRSRLAIARDAMLSRIPISLRVGIDASVRAGIAAVAALVVAASVVGALALGVGYAQLITFYETLHTEALGGLVLTVAQGAVLPNFVIWTMAWLVGPGFAVGTGSISSPFATALGPVPPIPIFGAIPSEPGSGAWIVLTLPLAAGLIAGILAHGRLRGVLRDWWLVVVGIAGGICGGIIAGLLAAASAGSGGPGRLADLGPDGVQVGVWAGVEFAIAITIGLLVAGTIRGLRSERLSAPSDDAGIAQSGRG